MTKTLTLTESQVETLRAALEMTIANAEVNSIMETLGFEDDESDECEAEAERHETNLAALLEQLG